MNKEDSRASGPVAVEVWQRKVSAMPLDGYAIKSWKVRLFRNMHIP